MIHFFSTLISDSNKTRPMHTLHTNAAGCLDCVKLRERIAEQIMDLLEWSNGPQGGAGSSFHSEKWPPLTPGARKRLKEIAERLAAGAEASNG